MTLPRILATLCLLLPIQAQAGLLFLDPATGEPLPAIFSRSDDGGKFTTEFMDPESGYAGVLLFEVMAGWRERGPEGRFVAEFGIKAFDFPTNSSGFSGSFMPTVSLLIRGLEDFAPAVPPRDFDISQHGNGWITFTATGNDPRALMRFYFDDGGPHSMFVVADGGALPDTWRRVDLQIISVPESTGALMFGVAMLVVSRVHRRRQ